MVRACLRGAQGIALSAAICSLLAVSVLLAGPIIDPTADPAWAEDAACVTPDAIKASDSLKHPSVKVLYALEKEAAGNFLVKLYRIVDGLPPADAVTILTADGAPRIHVLLIRGGCVVAAGFLPTEAATRMAGQES